MSLRAALLANAAFSGACAVAVLAVAPRLAPHFSAPSWLLYTVGITLVVYAVILVMAVQSIGRQRAYTPMFVAMDHLWVAGSLVLLGFAPASLSPLGAALVAVIACAVGTLAVWQTVALGGSTDHQRQTVQS